jgi:hypothetical protein
MKPKRQKPKKLKSLSQAAHEGRLLYAQEVLYVKVQKSVRAFLDGGGAERLGYLCDRWRDEREYEDWNGYIDEMKKIVPEGFKFERAGKSPFGFTATADWFPGALHITATQGSVRVKHIRV